MALPGGGDCVKMGIVDSGLGLAILHAVEHKHSGLISVRAITSIVTTGAIYLPVSKNDATASDRGRDAVQRKRPSRILMMDVEQRSFRRCAYTGISEYFPISDLEKVISQIVG